MTFTKEENRVFNTLFHLDVNERVEKKQSGGTQLSYLSWAWAWAEIKKRYEDANYKILKFENNLPYVFDPNTGYMVFTEVTIDSITHEMWLPVMDSANKAMLNRSYTYEVAKYEKRDGQKVKVGTTQKTVLPATMFDVNKTIMRCLVKNLAMFGLGLYIYSGEDLPEPEPVKEASDSQKEDVRKLFHKLSEYTGRAFESVEYAAVEYLKLGEKTTDNIDVEDYAKLIAYLQPTVAKFEAKAKQDAELKAKKAAKKAEGEPENVGLDLQYPQTEK